MCIWSKNVLPISRCCSTQMDPSTTSRAATLGVGCVEQIGNTSHHSRCISHLQPTAAPSHDNLCKRDAAYE